MIQSSDLPEDNRLMVRLRQACAENRLTDATRIYDKVKAMNADRPGSLWVIDRIMQKEQEAFEHLASLENNEDLRGIGDMLTYAYFDARQFPNLMALLEAQGIEPREPLDIPYRCKI